MEWPTRSSLGLFTRSPLGFRNTGSVAPSYNVVASWEVRNDGYPDNTVKGDQLVLSKGPGFKAIENAPWLQPERVEIARLQMPFNVRNVEITPDNDFCAVGGMALYVWDDLALPHGIARVRPDGQVLWSRTFDHHHGRFAPMHLGQDHYYIASGRHLDYIDDPQMDYMVRKHDAVTGDLVWEHFHAWPWVASGDIDHTNEVRGLAVDESDGSYYIGTNYYLGYWHRPRTVALTKYDADGNEIWRREYDNYGLPPEPWAPSFGIRYNAIVLVGMIGGRLLANVREYGTNQWFIGTIDPATGDIEESSRGLIPGTQYLLMRKVAGRDELLINGSDTSRHYITDFDFQVMEERASGTSHALAADAHRVYAATNHLFAYTRQGVEGWGWSESNKVVGGAACANAVSG